MGKITKLATPTTPEEPIELSLGYFHNNPRTYSSQVLGNLASNPLFQFLFDKKPKEPTTKDMLLVASVVVSAADQKIVELETEKLQLKKEASAIRTLLGNPIWSVRALPAAPDEIADTSAASKKAEQQWVARYLTLGNVLGAIVVTLGMLGGVFTYFTTNYKDKAGRFQADAAYWQKERNDYKAAAEDAQKAKETATQNAQKQHDDDSKTIKDINDRLSQSQTLSSGLSDQVKQANKKIEELQNQKPPDAPK